MTQTTSPALTTALAYHQAWTSQHLDQAMTYIADDITCDAPRKSRYRCAPEIWAPGASQVMSSAM